MSWLCRGQAVGKQARRFALHNAGEDLAELGIAGDNGELGDRFALGRRGSVGAQALLQVPLAGVEVDARAPFQLLVEVAGGRVVVERVFSAHLPDGLSGLLLPGIARGGGGRGDDLNGAGGFSRGLLQRRKAAFLLDGQGLTAVFGRYAQQIEAISYEGAGLADHAPGVYSLMTVASVREFSGMGMYLAFASALLVAFALIHARREPDADTLLLAALLLAAGLPLILPQMNARCLYLAGMLAFACVNGARRLAIAIVLELISLCSYMEAIFSFTVIPMNVLSLLAIACAAALVLELMGKLGIKGAQIGESDA